MSRFTSYLNTAIKIIQDYDGKTPLAVFLKKFFSANKKYGARDRRQISSLCYHYFRLGKAGSNLSYSDKIIAGTFLCDTASSDFLEDLKPEWNTMVAEPLAQKITFIKNELNIENIFPFATAVSEDVDSKAFSQSFLIQPDLFLRIRPRVKLGVMKKLEKSKLNWKLIGEDCVVMPNSTAVEELFLIDKEVVIQDYNSQKTLDFFKPQNAVFKTPARPAWDCCAASGGKSMLLLDIFNHRIDLTISDIRPSVILNLHHRFARAGIKSYHYFVGDLGSDQFEESLPAEQRANLNPEIIICDVPCTGSGTWSRTPEQLFFFNQEMIEAYSIRQKKIVSNVIPHLQPEGIFVYITCSVFRQENEEVADFIKEKSGLNLLSSKILTGYDTKADTMFVAVFRKS